MIANLPLLFANGNPTALSKITAEELERFITFMVTCSWGHDTAKDIKQPPWWPRDVGFTHPFVRPQEVPKDWEAKLKNLVRKCYDYHKSTFLLVFSAQLARYPRNRLRYVDNRDHTTSLYYRPSSRLLVTFRNENLFYDRHAPIEIDEPQVRPADIYLCDSCDSHFDNLDVLTAHERLCNSQNLPSSSTNSGLADFLSALKLQPLGGNPETAGTAVCNQENRSRNIRSAANIDRGPPYPFSSLAYMRNVKPNVHRDTSYSRERVERYCCAPFTSNSKPVVSKSRNQQFPVRYRRPIDYWHRQHTFPHQRKKKLLDLKSQLLLLKCRPVNVVAENMSPDSIQEYIDNLRLEAERRVEKDIVYVDGSECEVIGPNDARDPLRRVEDCEVIDLCSDSEETCAPRAGVACIMRGGAVLRRARPATPRRLPDEPSGARHRPLALPAVLQPHPHPVIFIAHTLNHLQTISLE